MKDLIIFLLKVAGLWVGSFIIGLSAGYWFGSAGFLVGILLVIMFTIAYIKWTNLRLE